MKRLLAVAALLLLPVAPAAAEAPLFDDHVHLHDGAASLAAYRADLARAGVSLTRIGAMWFGGPNQALAGDPASIRRGNDSILALAANNPDLLPIATVHPYDGDAALAELDRVAARGVRVLKIHPHTQEFDPADPRVKTLVTRAGALGLVVLMDNANILPGDSEKLFNLALACPKTRFIFAHMGGMNFRFWNILMPAKRAKGLFADNIYFDISATVMIVAGSPIRDEFVWTMRNVGIDHILLGSDYPQYTLPQTLAAFETLGLTEAEKAQIRYGTAKALLGFE
ncbi:amidohydrolase family protein [Sphingomonas sp. BIUV-7]|uniref:Amidohydrolase family protein n=1 Tax=Sphingomonas natans TaxID=3063330 RepID=A0ABT8YD68_9SPHN|nr:amidohydrolase family protein [Sphingomonas sp. BIUV-7]MDO6415738.1 amidohydrolase family protein [Sphingomonas sp. BIUV-7]